MPTNKTGMMRRLLASAPALFFIGASGALAEPPTSSCISVIPSTGATSVFGAFFPIISADGRFAVFTSASSGFVPGDTNNRDDVFMRDLESGAITRVSLTAAGGQANGNSFALDVSPDGRFVVFSSFSSNLAPPASGFTQVYLRDRAGAVTELISVAMSGAPTNETSLDGAMSADGGRVAFASVASNIVPGDTNGKYDIFLRERSSGVTTLLTVGASGEPANGNSRNPTITSDGRYVFYESGATNLLSDGLADGGHIYMCDTQTGTTTRITQPGAGGAVPRVSGDGRFVVFISSSPVYAPGNAFGVDHVILHDRITGEFRLVSETFGGVTPVHDARHARISRDGRFVAFDSRSPGLVPGFGGEFSGVFLYDREINRLALVSLTSAGTAPNGPSEAATVADGGARVVFQSDSESMHMPDTNDEFDAYLRQSPDSLFCPGDVNSDYRVDMADLSLMLSAHNTSHGDARYLRNADFDADGDVDFADLNVVVWAFNKGC